MSITEDHNKKALVVTTVASTLDQFCMNDISILQKSHKVYVAANFKFGNNTSRERVNEFKSELQQKHIVINDIGLNRNPTSKDNIVAYREIKRLIDKYSFDIIHCHTPVAAMLVRIAARNSRKNGTRVIYTAHGFHFYKGAPLKNWFLFYPVEWWLARYTDVLITINSEDYKMAKKNLKAKSIRYIPGVGVDIGKFTQKQIDKIAKRKEMGLTKEVYVVLSVGELNKNKNHETVIKAIAKLNNPNIYYLICGQGVLEGYLIKMIKELGIEKQVVLLGFRKDIAEICKVADVFAFPSFREGLSVSLMEAMSTGLPVVCSKIRGNIDLIQDGKGGYLVDSGNMDGFKECIEKLVIDEEKRKTFGDFNQNYIRKFSIENVKEQMAKVYEQ